MTNDGLKIRLEIAIFDSYSASTIPKSLLNAYFYVKMLVNGDKTVNCSNFSKLQLQLKVL